METARLESVRTLADGVERLPPDPRPCVALMKRRPHDQRGYWVYRLAFVDQEFQFAWETLLAITASTRVASPAASHVRACLTSIADRLAPLVAREQEHAREAISTSMQAPLELAARREHAIVEALTEHRARLSAALLQRGLFDRRGEREAASQTAVIEEALARCAVRLREIELSAHINADRAALAFALLRR